MSGTPVDRKGEIERLTAAANKMAKRLNGRFVLDEKKVSGFSDRRQDRVAAD